MAVSQWKGTIFFTCLEAGWTENYWLQGPDMNTAISQLDQILLARVALSNSQVVTQALRVVDAGNPRVSALPVIPAGGDAGTWTGAPGTTTISPDISYLCRGYDATGLRRTRTFIRGVPNDQAAGGSGGPDFLFTFTAPYVTLQGTYQNTVKSNALMVHKTAPHTFSSVPFDHFAMSTAAHIRRAGRPFNLRRGRRLIA